MLLLACGLIFLAARLGSCGWSLVLITPVILGILLAFVVPVRKIFLYILGGTLVLAVVGFAITAEVAGLLCGMVPAGVLFLPLVLGVSVGSFLRTSRHFKSRSAKRLVIFCLAVAPIISLYVESRIPRTFAEESVETSRVISAPAEDLWAGLVFYEEVRQSPPWIARIGIPRPLYTLGRIKGEDDVKVCVYDKGRLVKRIRKYRPTELFAFTVIEQSGVEDRSVQLTEGSFRFESAGLMGTRVTLTTRYRPKLPARVFWRPWERAVVRALHHHVLDEMTRRTNASSSMVP